MHWYGWLPKHPVDLQFYYPNFEQTMIRKRNELFVTIGAVVFLFGFILQQILQRVLSKPIMNMVSVASRFSCGETQLRFNEGRRDELGYMAKFINTALDNLINEQRATGQALKDLSESQRALQQQHDLLEIRVQERTEALSAANRELEAYSYSIAHDLRQPLRAIDGFSLLLLEDFGHQLDAEAHGHMRRVREAAQRMGRLIDDLLQLSKITRSEVIYRDVDLSAEARAVVEHLRASQPEHRVQVEIGAGMQRKADPGLVRIILDNLIGNAWKYSTENPAARIEFNCTDSHGTTVYYVSDNGVGFDEAYSDKLFRPFERLHSERRFKGTGIGLATVARAVQRMGGDVWAESRIGDGATFYFTLEARRPAPSVKQWAATTRRCSANRMLYVRQAAAVSMTSTPIRDCSKPTVTCGAGKFSWLPVPSSSMSGCSATTASKSACDKSSTCRGRQAIIARPGLSIRLCAYSWSSTVIRPSS